MAELDVQPDAAPLFDRASMLRRIPLQPNLATMRSHPAALLVATLPDAGLDVGSATRRWLPPHGPALGGGVEAQAGTVTCDLAGSSGRLHQLAFASQGLVAYDTHCAVCLLGG